jgi:hypothetical protein
MVIQSVGQARTSTAPRHDEVELARAIRLGARRRPDQAFGEYYVGRRASCALGAAYEGIHLLPPNAEKIDPVDLGRLFDCLDYTLRRCPVGCGKGLALAAMILHLNDDHQWSREQIADWVAPEAPVTA